MIQDLIRERDDRKEDVLREIASKWGRDQTVSGPLLVIPYYTTQIERIEEDEKSN